MTSMLTSLVVKLTVLDVLRRSSMQITRQLNHQCPDPFKARYITDLSIVSNYIRSAIDHCQVETSIYWSDRDKI